MIVTNMHKWLTQPHISTTLDMELYIATLNTPSTLLAFNRWTLDPLYFVWEFGYKTRMAMHSFMNS